MEGKRIEQVLGHLQPAAAHASPAGDPYAGQDKALSPFVRGGFTPVDKEVVVQNLPVQGSIPRDLEGEYIKNGPNAFFMPKPDQPYHWFDGDGMLNAVIIKDGKVSFLNKWVRTTRFLGDQETREPIFEFGELMSGNLDPIVNTRDENGERHGRAQTSVLYHARKFYALEENDKPYHVRLPLLDTVRRDDFGGQLEHIFAAHPKINPRTGELFVFGYEINPIPPFKVHYSVFDKVGKLIVRSFITIREPIFMHDFAITDEYMIFYDIPARFKFDQIYEGQNPWVHEEQVPSRFGLVPIHSAEGDRDVRWFEAPSCMIFHTANAYREGDEVVLECPRADTYSMAFAGMTDPKVWLYLHQWRFNLRTGQCLCANLTQVRADFPIINPQYVGVKNRYTFLTTYRPSPDNTPWYDGWAKYDRQTGATTVVKFGEQIGGGECLFQPRPNPQGEDDGYLLVFVTDEARDVSQFRIYDARSPSAQPLAIVPLPQRVPYGFHGAFVTQQQIEDQEN